MGLVSLVAEGRHGASVTCERREDIVLGVFGNKLRLAPMGCRKPNDRCWNLRRDGGQATIELAVMLPIILIIAVIAVNVILFFGHCAMFDRSFNQTVTMLATSPGYSQTVSNSKALVESELSSSFDNDYLDFEVAVNGVSGGYYKFSGTLKMHPTLFGMGLKDEVFGVAMPTLNHSQEIVIDIYKPGVIF